MGGREGGYCSSEVNTGFLSGGGTREEKWERGRVLTQAYQSWVVLILRIFSFENKGEIRGGTVPHMSREWEWWGGKGAVTTCLECALADMEYYDSLY